MITVIIRKKNRFIPEDEKYILDQMKINLSEPESQYK